MSSSSSYAAFLEAYARALLAAETPVGRLRQWASEMFRAVRPEVRVETEAPGTTRVAVAFPAVQTQRDVARARALLREAGVTTPLAVEMTVPNNPDLRQVGEVIQSMAAEAGFAVTLRAMEFASSLQAATRGEFQTYLVGWSGRVDPDGNITTFTRTGGGQNDGRYSNPEVDRLLDAARVELDVAKRRDLCVAQAEQARQDLPGMLADTRCAALDRPRCLVESHRQAVDPHLADLGMTHRRPQTELRGPGVTIDPLPWLLDGRRGHARRLKEPLHVELPSRAAPLTQLRVDLVLALETPR